MSLQETDEVDRSGVEVEVSRLRRAVLVIGPAEVLRALRAHGTIAWFRISAGVDPLDSLVRPPLVVWRYADPRDRVRLAIPPTVETFEGNVGWVADVSAENWYLAPQRVRDELSGAAPGYPGVLSDLKHEDQDFCIRATRDLELLLARIERLHD